MHGQQTLADSAYCVNTNEKLKVHSVLLLQMFHIILSDKKGVLYCLVTKIFMLTNQNYSTR